MDLRRVARDDSSLGRRRTRLDDAALVVPAGPAHAVRDHGFAAVGAGDNRRCRNFVVLLASHVALGTARSSFRDGHGGFSLQFSRVVCRADLEAELRKEAHAGEGWLELALFQGEQWLQARVDGFGVGLGILASIRAPDTRALLRTQGDKRNAQK
jgi:hypothetical protein